MIEGRTSSTDGGGGVKIAIGTRDGIAVTEHFGWAEQFQIWRLGPEGPGLVETRRNAPACGGDPAGDASAAMDHSIALVADCRAVVVARIGECALTRLTALGILAFEADEPVEATLRELTAYAARLEEEPA